MLNVDIVERRLAVTTEKFEVVNTVSRPIDVLSVEKVDKISILTVEKFEPVIVENVERPTIVMPINVLKDDMVDVSCVCVLCVCVCVCVCL